MRWIPFEGAEPHDVDGNYRGVYTYGNGERLGVVSRVISDVIIAVLSIKGATKLNITKKTDDVIEKVIQTERNIKGIRNVKFAPNLEKHIIYVDTTVPRSRGIGGAHNLNEFNKNNVNIVKTTNHPTVNGIQTIEYQIPALDPKTGAQTGWKSKIYTKTIYDPSIIADEQFIKWGKEAASDAFSTGNINGREWVGTSNNGIRFRGYLDETGEVNSFYPDF